MLGKYPRRKTLRLLHETRPRNNEEEEKHRENKREKKRRGLSPSVLLQGRAVQRRRVKKINMPGLLRRRGEGGEKKKRCKTIENERKKKNERARRRGGEVEAFIFLEGEGEEEGARDVGMSCTKRQSVFFSGKLRRRVSTKTERKDSSFFFFFIAIFREEDGSKKKKVGVSSSYPRDFKTGGLRPATACCRETDEDEKEEKNQNTVRGINNNEKSLAARLGEEEKQRGRKRRKRKKKMNRRRCGQEPWSRTLWGARSGEQTDIAGWDRGGGGEESLPLLYLLLSLKLGCLERGRSKRRSQAVINSSL